MMAMMDAKAAVAAQVNRELGLSLVTGCAQQCPCVQRTRFGNREKIIRCPCRVICEGEISGMRLAFET